MSNLTLPSGTGDARFMAFLKALRDEIVDLKAQQGGGDGGLTERLSTLETALNTASTGLVARVSALETTVNAATTGLVDRVTALETPGS